MQLPFGIPDPFAKGSGKDDGAVGNGAAADEQEDEAPPDPNRKMFFQGPTPLTGVQEGMPDFFSKENLIDNRGTLAIWQKGFIGVAAILFLGLIISLIVL
jgi:hypothetical protein